MGAYGVCKTHCWGLPFAHPANNDTYVHGVLPADVKRNAGALRTEPHTNNDQYVHCVRFLPGSNTMSAFVRKQHTSRHIRSLGASRRGKTHVRGRPFARPANNDIYVHVVLLATVKRNTGAVRTEPTQITINTSIVCFLPMESTMPGPSIVGRQYDVPCPA